LKYSSVYCPRVPRLCHVSEINSIPFCIRAHIFSLAHHHSTWASDGSYLQRRLAGPQFASQILITIAMHYQHLPVLGYLFVENKDTTTVVDIGIRCVCNAGLRRDSLHLHTPLASSEEARNLLLRRRQFIRSSASMWCPHSCSRSMGRIDRIRWVAGYSQ
jgi:hypothetical protein